MATAEQRMQSAERRSAPSQPSDPERAVVQISPRQATVALASIAAILAALSIGQHLYPGNDIPIERINLDSEISIPTWFQSTLLLLSGALTALIAVLRSRASRSYVRHWIVAAVALILLSGDEMLALHEMLIDPMRALLDVGGGLVYFAWIVPGAVVAVAFGATYLRFLGHLPERIRKLFVTAGVLYLMGALGMEAIDEPTHPPKAATPSGTCCSPISRRCSRWPACSYSSTRCSPSSACSRSRSGAPTWQLISGPLDSRSSDRPLF